MKYTFFFFLLIVFIQTADAQKRVMVNGLDGSNNATPTLKKNNKKTDAYKDDNIVKLDLALLLRGTVSASYERFFMDDRFSVEGTIGANLWEDLFFIGSLEDFGNTNDDSLSYKDFNNGNNPFNPSIKNLYLGGAARVYTNEQESRLGYYIYRLLAGIDVRVFKQSFMMVDYQSDPANANNKILNINNQYIGGQIGYMIESDYHSGTYELTLGLGLLLRQSDQLVWDGVSGSGFYLINEPKHESRPYFTLGVKYGFKF